MPVPSPPYLILKTPHLKEGGQSLVEFAVSSVILLLLVGGLVDIGRSIYVSEALSNAAREGARHGAWFQAPSQSHPYLYDDEIKVEVDAELATTTVCWGLAPAWLALRATRTNATMTRTASKTPRRVNGRRAVIALNVRKADPS